MACTEVSTKGSHHKIRNDKNNKVTVVAIHNGEILYPAMFSAILKQLEIDINDFIDFIQR